MNHATYTPIRVPTRGLDMATMQQQLELEYLMLQSGIDRYNKQLDDLVGKSLSSKTLHGRTIISGVCEPLADVTETLRTNYFRVLNLNKQHTLHLSQSLIR